MQKFAFIQEPERQLRLFDQLNELCITDIDAFERAVGDLTFANDVARDYFNTTLLCGWAGDYGKFAVHITDQEETRQPDSTAASEDVPDITTDGARRLAKGGRLPRPVFDLASGTTTTMTSSNFKITQDETSRPIFPRRANRFESADDGNYRDLTDTDSGRSSDSAQHANPSIRKEYK